MKKRFLKALIVAALVCVSAVSLVACGFGAGQAGNEAGKDTEAIKTGKKVTFADVEKEYENATVKEAVSISTLQMSVFSFNKGTDEIKKHTMAVSADADRITNGDKSYAKATLRKGDSTTDDIVGLLGQIKDIANSGGILSFLPGGSNIVPGKDTLELINELSDYIEYVQAFLLDKIELNAEAGRGDATTNVKAKYSYNKAEETLCDEAWFYITDAVVNGLFGFDMNKVDFAHSIYPVTFVDVAKGKDSASDRVDKNGHARYDFDFTSTSILNHISNLIDEYSDKISTDTEDKKLEVQKVVEKMLGWIDVDMSKFTATVGNNKLPIETELTSTLKINLDRNELKDILNSLSKKGVIEEKDAKAINGLIGILDSLLCGTDGTKNNVIGIELGFNAKETYRYDEKSCSLDAKDAELFLGGDSEGEGRYNIGELIVELTAEEIEKAITVLTEEYGEIAGIAEEVKARLAECDKITLAEVKKAVAAVIEEYKANKAEEKGENSEKSISDIKQAVSDAIDGYIKK